MLMGFSFATPDCRSIFNSDEVKERLVAIGRTIFSYNSDKTDDLRLTNLVDMPESKKAAQNVAKVLKRIINNWFAKTNWTLDNYEELVEECQNNPAFVPVGEIESVLILLGDCFSQAYLTERSSKPEFWSSLSELEHQELLAHFNNLLKWRLSNSFDFRRLERFQMFNMSIVYGVDFKESFSDYKNNIDTYLQNISNVLTKNIIITSDDLHKRQEDIKGIELTQSNIKLNDLVGLYNFVNYEEAQRYLTNDINLLTLIKNAYDKIVEYFNPDNISLYFIESFDLSEPFTLKIKVKVPYDANFAIDKRKNFNRNYWFKLPSQLTKNIIIALEF